LGEYSRNTRGILGEYLGNIQKIVGGILREIGGIFRKFSVNALGTAQGTIGGKLKEYLGNT
jgi:hypothetical protein